MKYIRGKALYPGEKMAIVSVKESFFRNKTVNLVLPNPAFKLQRML